MTEHIVTSRDRVTVERLRELLHYDPETGIFRWLVTIKHVKAGDIAGCRTAKGYWQIKIDRRVYRAHRLAWLYVHGDWPSQLDHKRDGPLRNQIDNLRLCNGRQNNANTAIRSWNKSGFKGVYKNGSWSTWVARIGGYGNREFLGCYSDPRAAALAYDAAAVRLFGEFARTNKMLGLLPLAEALDAYAKLA